VSKIFERIDGKLRSWIAEQAMFFVGTAPLAADGHVNVSPKGPIGSLRVLDDLTVAYLDVVGSGAETIAHVRENGRIVVMLCAFQGPPRIVRLHGKGEVVLPGDARFDELLARASFDEPALPVSRRAIVLVTVERVADACGYGVPRMRFESERTQMTLWAEKKLASGGEAAIAEYKRKKNTTSIDGLPAVDPVASARGARGGEGTP